MHASMLRLEAMMNIKVQAYFSMAINQGLRHIKKRQGQGNKLLSIWKFGPGK